jgi:hypothetical protein
VAEWQTQRIQNPPPPGREGSTPSSGTMTIMRAPLARLLATAALPLLVAACTDGAKQSAERARGQAEDLAGVTAADVAELERGMPAGAAELAKTLYASGNTTSDVPLEPTDVRKALKRIRSVVPDLRSAKSTFMALATVDGVGIRSDLEEDRMAGMKLFETFKGFAGAKGSAFSKTIGTFDEAGGPVVDDDFAAMVPVTVGGEVRSLLLSGWTFRAFARHLQAQAEMTMAERRKAGTEAEKAPVLYVAVADARGTFGSPTTPRVNLDAVQALEPAKLAHGATGTKEIEGRRFGWGAAKAPAMGPDVTIVVLRSDL